MPLLRKNLFRVFIELALKHAKHFGKLELAKHFESAKQVMNITTRLAKLVSLELAKHFESAKQVMNATRLAPWRCLAGAILIASMLPNLLKSQTVDQGVIQTTDNQTEWTTGKIETPSINWVYPGLPLSIFYNDADNTSMDGYWHNVSVSDNVAVLNPGVSGDILYSLENIPDSTAEQPITINYILSDSLNGHHGVGGKIDRRADRYEIDCTIAYTDTATNQPTSISFKLPNHLAKYFMDWDTTASIPFDPGISYTSTGNPEKLDSILNNIQDVMVLPEFEQNKTNTAQMNETSPYSGQGDAINLTLENITDGGLGNPWNPEIFTMFMQDHSQKSLGYSPSYLLSTLEVLSKNPSPPRDEDLETMVFKTTNGDITVKYFMPDTTVTHPGADIINIYEMTISDTNFKPDVQVNAGGLPTNVSTTQVNDSVYNIAVSVKTPKGQTGTYPVSVDLNAIQIAIPEIQKPVDYEATNFPNPFTSNTTIRYSLKDEDNVNITLYDMKGKVVKEVFNGKQSAGMHELTIDGSEYSAGLYFANITGKEGSHAIKLFKKF